MDPEGEFWKEDADRINAMAEGVRDNLEDIQVLDGDPPALNPDGSLADEAESGTEADPGDFEEVDEAEAETDLGD